jgi:hypothetical protein
MTDHHKKDSDENLSYESMLGDHYLSFVYKRIKQDKLIALSNYSEFPDHAKQDRDVIEKIGFSRRFPGLFIKRHMSGE